jgi:16S rRNA (uracil1498-N3)-methyltransferase
MNHFFIDPQHIQESKVLFPSDVSHQIVRVLRLKMDSTVMVLDNHGHQFEVRLEKLDVQQCIGKIMQTLKIETEPETRLHLLVAMTQREKFEWILQKSCEIGVHKITPIMSERSIQIPVSVFQKKKERWERILKEAAEQCRRGMIPALNAPLQIQAAIHDPAPIRLFAWENEQNQRLNDLFENQNSAEISLLIGPEGGFSEQEVESANSLGWIPFSLGKRILRMETAAVVASALILNQCGDI